MKTLNEYWNESFKRHNLKLKYDNWLDKYNLDLEDLGAKTIVDLGCGLGNNTLYLSEKGISPIACDISEEAIKKINVRFPNVGTLCFDMVEGLPFTDKSIHIIIADLSIHYFDEETTASIINDIHRVLREDGLFLCRLNSVKEMLSMKQAAQGSDKYFVQDEGIHRRYFDRQEIDRFFRGDVWRFENLEEYELDRYIKKKILWEIAIKKK